MVTASGTKTWNDDNDKDGKRPDKITVRLHANGVEVASKEVGPNAQGEWKYEFTDLPATGADGKILFTQLLKTVFMAIQLLLMV